MDHALVRKHAAGTPVPVEQPYAPDGANDQGRRHMRAAIFRKAHEPVSIEEVTIDNEEYLRIVPWLAFNSTDSSLVTPSFGFTAVRDNGR